MSFYYDQRDRLKTCGWPTLNGQTDYDQTRPLKTSLKGLAEVLAEVYVTGLVQDTCGGSSMLSRFSPLHPYLFCALARRDRTRRQMLPLVTVSVKTSLTNL